MKLDELCEEVRNRVSVSDIPLSRYVNTDTLLKHFGGRIHAESMPATGSLVAFRKNDLLLSNIRPYLRKLWLADCDGGCSSDVIVLRAHDIIDSGYLRLALSQDYFFDYVMRDPSGTKMPRGKRPHIMRFTLPLPPLSVQRDIVARLDAGLARADRMRERFLALAESASARFRAILAETFEQGENGDSWPRVKLGEIGRVVTGSTPSTSHKEYYGGKWPLFKPTDLDAGLEVVTASDSLTDAGWNCARRLPENAVLVTCIGATLGKTGIIRKKGTCNQQINAIVPEKAIPEFLYYALISPGFQKTLWRTSNATTLPIVNKARFETLSIPLPPMDIQRSIVARLDAARADCGRIEELARKGVEGCTALRAALLKEAFE